MLLITGGTGYIGQKLLQHLPNKQKVLVLTRSGKSSSAKLAPNVSLVKADLSSEESLEQIKDQLKQVTSVIHLASKTHAFSKDEYYAANLKATKSLLAVLPKTLKHFVYASTVCAEPGSGGYGESKRATEAYLKKSLSKNVNLTILRIADVFGGEGEKSIEQFLKLARLLPIMPLVGSGNIVMAPVHVNDVVKALVKATQLTGQQTLIIAGIEKITFKELAKQVFKKYGKPFFYVPIPLALFSLLFAVVSYFKKDMFYPDQLQRLTVTKNYNSEASWGKLSLKPESFLKWLKLAI